MEENKKEKKSFLKTAGKYALIIGGTAVVTVLAYRNKELIADTVKRVAGKFKQHPEVNEKELVEVAQKPQPNFHKQHHRPFNNGGENK